MCRSRFVLALIAIACGTALGLNVGNCHALADVRDSLTVSGRVSAAEHEIAEGYFEVTDALTIIAQPGSELHGWLAAHRGQRIVVSVREWRGVKE